MENNKKQMFKTVNGVTYFKLRSDFEGDYTKNCGLLGEEIDENFYFLRGYDIADIYMDRDKNLIIERVDNDYPSFKVNLGEICEKDKFYFNKETGTITVTYPDGTTSTMDGFIVEGQDIRMATDNSIDGDGTIYRPLSISPVYSTGTYAPASKFVDLTKVNKMPIGEGKGYRIVTKEAVNGFGCLYPFEAVKMIQNKLIETKSQWRVATKEDWDDLLNAMETNPDYRNHNSISSGWHGRIAGSALKSSNLWEKYNTNPNEVPVEGQDIVGLSILPLGIGPERNEIMNDSDSDLEGFGKLSGFWTSTSSNTGDAFVKVFGYDKASVRQDTYGEGAKMSIRLVKDYTLNNYENIETILGLVYPTELVYGICDDMPYAKVWTKINVYNRDQVLSGVTSNEWSTFETENRGTEIVYFINEWNGYEWVKKPMNDGDSVVIKNYKDEKYHEWRIINGELIDTLKDTLDVFNKTIEDINNRIETEEEKRREEDSILLDTIKNETLERENEDNKLKEELSNEAIKREEEDKKLQDKINRVNNDLKDRLGDIENKLKSEVEERKNEDKKLSEIDNQLQDKIISLDNKVINQVTSLKETIESEFSKVTKDFEKEVNERKISDSHLEAMINEEKVNRDNNDITPGGYTIEKENITIIPTKGENVDDIKLNISSDFFNFGNIINE